MRGIRADEKTAISYTQTILHEFPLSIVLGHLDVYISKDLDGA